MQRLITGVCLAGAALLTAASIYMWEPVPQDAPPSGIVLARIHGMAKRWASGLTWSDISADMVLTKETTKTGAVVSHDLRLCPLVMDVLQQYPVHRIGPVIIDEKAGSRMLHTLIRGNGVSSPVLPAFPMLCGTWTHGPAV